MSTKENNRLLVLQFAFQLNRENAVDSQESKKRNQVLPFRESGLMKEELIHTQKHEILHQDIIG